MESRFGFLCFYFTMKKDNRQPQFFKNYVTAV